MESRTIGLSAAAVGVGVQAFGLFLPPAIALRLDAPAGSQQDKADDVRSGEVFATAATVAVCLLIAYYDRSPVPFLAGIAAAALMVTVYEWALSGARY